MDGTLVQLFFFSSFFFYCERGLALWPPAAQSLFERRSHLEGLLRKGRVNDQVSTRRRRRRRSGGVGVNLLDAFEDNGVEVVQRFGEGLGLDLQQLEGRSEAAEVGLDVPQIREQSRRLRMCVLAQSLSVRSSFVPSQRSPGRPCGAERVRT